MKFRNAVISVIMIFAMLLIPACGNEKGGDPENTKNAKGTDATVSDMLCR